MIDGTEGLRTPVARIDKHILQHMLDETRDLLDEAPGYALEGARSTHGAMALTRADWMLMSVHNWICGQLTDGPAETLGTVTDDVEIDFETLSVALLRFTSRVDRLHARAHALDGLVGKPGDRTTGAAATAERPVRHASAQVLHIFGDPIPAAGQPNPVLETRRRLNCAFGGA